MKKKGADLSPKPLGPGSQVRFLAGTLGGNGQQGGERTQGSQSEDQRKKKKNRAVIVSIQPGGTATTLVLVIFYLEARGVNGHTRSTTT